MSARIIEIDRIVVHIRETVIRLAAPRLRHDRVRTDEPANYRVIVSCHVVIQPNLKFITLPSVAVICRGRAITDLTKGGVLHRVKQAAARIRGGAGAAQVVREQPGERSIFAHGDPGGAGEVILTLDLLNPCHFLLVGRACIVGGHVPDHGLDHVAVSVIHIVRLTGDRYRGAIG